MVICQISIRKGSEYFDKLSIVYVEAGTALVIMLKDEKNIGGINRVKN